ncbi:MAG: hypothetical protein LBL66_10295, partial [Clostridiales bacterium]|jgi:hypothetical protein|nr:hypothetical protein [Clostridiales bacterium]
VYSTLLEAKQTSGVADAAFKPEQGDALTGIGALALSQAASADGLRDAYTGVTAKFTVNGIIQGAANAAAFYLKHKGAFPDGGSASDPAAEAIRRVYPSAPANVNYGAYIRAGAPDGITVYLVNRVPFVEVRLEGFENAVMIYFTNIADDYRSAETFMTMVGAAWHDQNAFDAALEKGKKFWAAHHADYVGVADSDPEKAQYDKIMNRFDGGAAYAYEPVLASTLDRAPNGNWDAVMRDGEGYVYRIVKAFAEGKNDCYIVAASAESFAGQLVSYTLIEDAGESAGAARYFIRQVLTFPDRSKEQYIAGYLDADNFYLYLAKFAAPITAANYQTGDFMPNGKGTEGAEQSVADGFGEAGAYAVRSYEGITQGVVKAVRNLRETLQIQ